MLRILQIVSLLAAPVFILAQIASSEPKQIETASTEEELTKITQQLLDAVAVGDKAVWDKYLAEGCLYSPEDGRTLTKAQLLEELRPLPEGYVGQLRVANPQVREYGDTAIITYDAMEELEIYGQRIKTRFHTTETYLKREGRWQMIASQVLVVPGDLMPVELSTKLLDDYTGIYELAPGVTYTVSREENQLMGQRAGRAKESLWAESADRFFRKGVRGEKIFVRDRRGQVIKMIDRRDNNDLIWKRVK